MPDLPGLLVYIGPGTVGVIVGVLLYRRHRLRAGRLQGGASDEDRST